MTLDFDFDFLQDAVRLVDGRLEILDQEANTSPDPDSFGVYDKIEYITGFGFVACQTYIEAMRGFIGIEKHEALELGPEHRSGRTIVALVNACANHWKHSGAWPNGDLPGQAKKTGAIWCPPDWAATHRTRPLSSTRVN